MKLHVFRAGTFVLNSYILHIGIQIGSCYGIVPTTCLKGGVMRLVVFGLQPAFIIGIVDSQGFGFEFLPGAGCTVFLQEEFGSIFYLLVLFESSEHPGIIFQLLQVIIIGGVIFYRCQGFAIASLERCEELVKGFLPKWNIEFALSYFAVVEFAEEVADELGGDENIPLAPFKGGLKLVWIHIDPDL